MGMKFCCMQCGHVYLDSPNLDRPFIAKDYLPCPVCGNSKISGELLVEEKMPTPFDSISMTAKDSAGVIKKMKFGGSRSADGTIAQIEQVIDKRNRRYQKRVTLSDGTVVKDVEGRLDDQSLHGPTKKVD